MADFRRVVTALAVVVLLMGFASTASAQAVPPFTCNASAAVPPLLRSEGMTELVGDIVLRCTGGINITPAQIAAGTAVPVANFTVFLGNTNVTSRLLGNNQVSNASEAVLLIDEPGTAGAATLTSPATPLFGCPGQAVGPCPQTPAGTIPNLYQGLVSGNSVTFIGVPVNPPGTTAERVFRITNVRANTSAIGAGPAGTPGQVQAFISITGPTSIPLNNPTQVVGFVQSGLTTAVRSATGGSTSGISLRQCASISRGTRQAQLRFTENFATAFKVQTASPGSFSQTVPGVIYNTESGLEITTLTGGTFTTFTAGRADFGTRLRATFNNIPAGMQVWVSTINVGGNVNNVPFAQLTALSDAASTGAFSAVVPGATENNVDLAQVPLSSGSGVAVWEVRSASPLATETLDFAVHFVATSNPGANTPAIGTGTVSQSFAPAPPAFSASAGASASSVLPIPRFIDTGSARNLITIFACRTNLLFPFVTNQAGFDTGLAIANTSADPFGTTAQSGTCTWNYFGDNAPAAITSPTIAGGTVSVALASTAAPNFQGYVIAVCNFEFGHGFAFVSDVGARNLAMGYLALVLPEPARQSFGVALPQNTFGELLGQ